MLNAGSLNIDANALDSKNVKGNVFIKTSETSYYTENVANIANTTDNMGSFNIAELLEKNVGEEEISSLVIYSSARFGSDYAITSNGSAFVNLGNNLDILLNTVAFLTDRGDTIRIRKTTENVFITEATNQQSRIVVTIIFSVPIIIILVGMIVPLVRRRRK
jgi:hypothetical protein